MISVVAGPRSEPATEDSHELRTHAQSRDPTPFQVDWGTSDHELGLGGVGIPPYRALDTTYGRTYTVAYLPLHTPPRGHGNLEGFCGDQEITLSKRRCTAATVESPQDFRIMHGKKGPLKWLVRGPTKKAGAADHPVGTRPRWLTVRLASLPGRIALCPIIRTLHT